MVLKQVSITVEALTTGFGLSSPRFMPWTAFRFTQKTNNTEDSDKPRYKKQFPVNKILIIISPEKTVESPANYWKNCFLLIAKP